MQMSACAMKEPCQGVAVVIADYILFENHTTVNPACTGSPQERTNSCLIVVLTQRPL
jgi:hypothetical protein